MGTDKGENSELYSDPDPKTDSRSFVWLFFIILIVSGFAYAMYRYKVDNMIIGQEIRLNQESGAMNNNTTAPLCYLEPCSVPGAAAPQTTPN